MARYEIIIYWSDDDQAFIAEVPELPGCMADGKSYQEAIANAEVVMPEWLETAKERRIRTRRARRPVVPVEKTLPLAKGNEE